ncbi:MAG: hypothetical protein HYV07_10020 [Deltaproteobacteria bacterium]|nr:hypothetical protein [Deltaproteobacteria bacterium]
MSSSSYRCAHPHCELPNGGRCAFADKYADPVADCPELIHDSAPPQTVEAVPLAPIAEMFPPEHAAPWAGRALTDLEAEMMLRRSSGIVIAVLGERNAGKTCLMTSFFLQIANGHRATLAHRFASSRTLFGWYDLTQRASEWTADRNAEILGHTPVDTPPRFLHLGLRPADLSDDRHIDVLVSDIPGEWVTNWVRRAADAESRALGFFQRSDAIAILVDGEPLLGPKAALHDASSARMLDRVMTALKTSQRPKRLALVFTKLDRVLRDDWTPPDGKVERSAWGPIGKAAPRIWAALDRASNAGVSWQLFGCSAFPQAMSAGQPVGVVAPFAHLIRASDQRAFGRRIEALVAHGCRSFEAMRRSHE